MKNNIEPDGKSSEHKEDYLKTAKDLKKMNELALAIEVCDKGLEKNPSDSNIYILKSQIQIDKFKEDKNPGNLKSALLNLEKALKLNPQSYIAKILASQIYLKGKAYKKAKSMLEGILASLPHDEKASSMMAFIVKKEEKKARAEAPPEPPPPATAQKAPIKATEPPPADEDGVVIMKPDEATGKSEEEPGKAMVDTRPENDSWGADDKLVIDSDSDNDNAAHLEALSDKLTMFGRLEGLEAIFLVDNDGQLFKSINKSGLDENVIPSLVFNLYKASVMGMRRVGYGSFQRGVLTTPIGTIILVNVFYAILTLVIDNDSNLGAVETRIQRYLGEVTQ